ncbi:MAG: pilus assembly protein [Vicinamibacterales bacterium]|nr:pilus assembly protein [Vicinamibacterales bacterium]
MRRLLHTLKGLADTTGSNLIEGAILTPLLFMMTFGVVDFGYLLYTFVALENGVSQATRYAITGQAMDDPNNPGQKLGREASIKTAMRNATPKLVLPDADFVFEHLSPGAGSWTGGAGGPADVGKVTVTYAWKPLTPILKPFLTNGQMTVRVDSAMKNESNWD